MSTPNVHPFPAPQPAAPPPATPGGTSADVLAQMGLGDPNSNALAGAGADAGGDAGTAPQAAPPLAGPDDGSQTATGLDSLDALARSYGIEDPAHAREVFLAGLQQTSPEAEQRFAFEVQQEAQRQFSERFPVQFKETVLRLASSPQGLELLLNGIRQVRPDLAVSAAGRQAGAQAPAAFPSYHQQPAYGQADPAAFNELAEQHPQLAQVVGSMQQQLAVLAQQNAQLVGRLQQLEPTARAGQEGVQELSRKQQVTSEFDRFVRSTPTAQALMQDLAAELAPEVDRNPAAFAAPGATRAWLTKRLASYANAHARLSARQPPSAPVPQRAGAVASRPVQPVGPRTLDQTVESVLAAMEQGS